MIYDSKKEGILEFPRKVLEDGAIASFRAKGIKNYGRIAQSPLLKTQAAIILYGLNACIRLNFFLNELSGIKVEILT